MKFPLSLDLTLQLQKLARQEQSSLFSVLLAAFNIVLSAYTRQDDIVLGSAISGRTQVKFENIIGFFSNTVVLRSDLSANPTFIEFLQRIRNMLLSIYENQDIPFERVVSAIQPKRELARNPLVDIFFVMQDAYDNFLNFDGIKSGYFCLGYPAARADIVVEMQVIDQKIHGGIYYSTALFNHQTIKTFIINYKALLENIVLDPVQKINDISLIKKEDKFKLKNISDHMNVDSDQVCCIHKKFEYSVYKNPDAIALDYKNKKFSYCELNKAANRLGRYLQQNGILQGDKVAISAERSAYIVVAILACFKIGSAYVPVDLNHPRDYLESIFSDCNPKLTMTASGINERSKIYTDKIIDLNAEFFLNLKCSDKNLEIEIQSDSLAYIIYTSGTTGKPKGVMVSHNSIISLLHSAQGIFNFTPDDKVILFHSYTFDFSVWEMWIALYFGAQLIIPTEDIIRSADLFLAFIVDKGITILNQTPSYFNQLLHDKSIFPHPELLKLRLILLGGETIIYKYLLRWFEKYGDQLPQIFNVYGVTEATCLSSYSQINYRMLDCAQNIIGRAFPGINLYIFDKFLRLLPPGVSGEICIGGSGVSKGYLNLKSFTNHRFITTNSGEIIYKTGDIGRYLHDGSIEFLGRADYEIKLRGYRINLLGIQAVINHHDAIDNSAIFADGVDEKRKIIAFLLPKNPILENSNNIIESVKKYLRQNLPEYMVPADLYAVDSFILNRNGKLDFKEMLTVQLSKVDINRKSPKYCYSELKKQIMLIWCNLLNKKKYPRQIIFLILAAILC